MKPWLSAVALGLVSASIAAGADVQTNNFPQERQVLYQDRAKKNHVYLVQEPATIPPQPRVLIYMHGTGGMEEQGMDPKWASSTFSRLRSLMTKWQWVYVCPRDAEFSGLLQQLREIYHPEKIYLAGASA